MRALPRIRRSLCVAALAAAALAPGAAAATQIDVTAINGSFADGAGGWTSTAACAPLCSVTNTVDSGAGASTPGSATVVYTTLAGLLGGLASGTSTWTSPSFTWANATPDSAALAFARRATIGNLLTVGGSATMWLQLRDQTAGTLTTIASDGIATAEGSFTAHSLSLDPSLLRQGHSYRLLVTTNFAAAALLSNIRVAYDDIGLTATIDGGATGGSGGTPGTGGSGAPVGSGVGGTPGTGGAGTPASGSAALRLSAAATVRFSPGRRVALRVRATRAGHPVTGLVVTLRMGTTARRITTGRNGYASLELLRRVRSAAPRHVPGRQREHHDLGPAPLARCRPRRSRRCVPRPPSRPRLRARGPSGGACCSEPCSQGCSSSGSRARSPGASTTTRARARSTTPAPASSSPRASSTSTSTASSRP